MGTYVKQVKKYTQELQGDYLANLQDYPRVDNSFIERYELHDLTPHKELFAFNNSLSPIKQKELKLNKKNALLFLSQERLVSPSQAETYAESIDKYFDSELNFKSESLQKEVEILYSLFSDFMKENKNIHTQEEQEIFIKSNYSEIFTENKKTNTGFYKIESVKLFPNITNSKKKRRSPISLLDVFMEEEHKKKKKKKIEDEFKRTRRLDEALRDFLKKNEEKKQEILLQNQKIKKINEENNAFLKKYSNGEQ